MSAAIKESKHTPGPWTVSTAPGTVDVRAFDGRFIANVDCDKRTALVETDSNAKLIAAAPEMAEALRTLLNNASAKLQGETDYARWHGISAADIGEVLTAARAALAKAGL